MVSLQTLLIIINSLWFGDHSNWSKAARSLLPNKRNRCLRSWLRGQDYRKKKPTRLWGDIQLMSKHLKVSISLIKKKVIIVPSYIVLISVAQWCSSKTISQYQNPLGCNLIISLTRLNFSLYQRSKTNWSKSSKARCGNGLRNAKHYGKSRNSERRLRRSS